MARFNTPTPEKNILKTKIPSKEKMLYLLYAIFTLNIITLSVSIASLVLK